jgi:predicted esterase YcpF (UPF0227 family)
MPISVFLHGLDSSSHGSKGKFFRKHFPQMLMPDFSGDFETRMGQLNHFLDGRQGLTLIGSSFGGLMATAFAFKNPTQATRLILLAPALNFPQAASLLTKCCSTPTRLYIGKHDTVTPPAPVVETAIRIFNDLSVIEAEDGHQLRRTFPLIPWGAFLGQPRT